MAVFNPNLTLNFRVGYRGKIRVISRSRVVFSFTFIAGSIGLWLGSGLFLGVVLVVALCSGLELELGVEAQSSCCVRGKADTVIVVTAKISGRQVCMMLLS